MISGHCFRRLQQERRPGRSGGESDSSDLSTLLGHVIERFVRLGGADGVAVVVDLSCSPDTEAPPAGPDHPACARYANSDYCRESWQLHLAELHRQPDTHWHECDHHMLCAIVPIDCQQRCLAAIKVACPAAVGERRFRAQVELMDMLVKQFVASHGELLLGLAAAKQETRDSVPFAPARVNGEARRPPNHPRVLEAIRLIGAQLADSGLTVERVARELGMDPSYLGHTFVEQVGERMSRFIAGQRIERAKALLATTDWQVKRIASDTGHANPNWFCYVFRSFTGLTPGAYRKRVRQHPVVRKRE